MNSLPGQQLIPETRGNSRKERHGRSNKPHAEQTFQAVAFPSDRVALHIVWIDPRGVAVARDALHLRIAPHVCLAFIALSSSITSPDCRP